MEGILDSALTSAAWLHYTGQAAYNAAFQADLQNRLCVSVSPLLSEKSFLRGRRQCWVL